MRLDSRIKAAAGMASLVALLAATIGIGSNASAAIKSAGGCTASKNSEAIIDNSGSMASSDPDNFRAKFMDDYINIGGNQGKTLGAVKFSTTAAPLFAPQQIGAGTRTAMSTAFATLGAEGSTNYQDGFDVANASNPGATSRIFLSDGEPNQYPTSHLTPKIPAYVVGIGDFVSDPTAVATLTQLASETGGPPPFLISDVSQLQPVAGQITAAQNCKALVSFSDSFTSAGQAFTHKFKASGKSADIFTSWPTAGDVLDVVVVPPNPVKGKASVAKAKVTKSKGATFVTVHIKGLKKGQKVKLKVKSKTLPAPTTATTQIIR
jgi:hypothetical protein